MSSGYASGVVASASVALESCAEGQELEPDVLEPHRAATAAGTPQPAPNEQQADRLAWRVFQPTQMHISFSDAESGSRSDSATTWSGLGECACSCASAARDCASLRSTCIALPDVDID